VFLGEIKKPDFWVREGLLGALMGLLLASPVPLKSAKRGGTGERKTL